MSPDPAGIDGPAVVEQVWPDVIKDQDDDLSGVLRNVRVNRMPATRRAWANSWQTRAFLHLALRMLHESQLADSTQGSYGPPIWGVLRPERLAERALDLVPGPAAAELSTARWRETWSHREGFTEDLVAYLFRPKPYVRRLEALLEDGALLVPDGLRLGDFMLPMIRSEYDVAAANPVYGLQLWLTAAMPTHEGVARHVHLLEDESRPVRARIYAEMFTRYGLSPAGVEWADIADTCATALRGVLLRGRVHGQQPVMQSGEPALTAMIMALFCGWFGLGRAELEARLPVG